MSFPAGSYIGVPFTSIFDVLNSGYLEPSLSVAFGAGVDDSGLTDVEPCCRMVGTVSADEMRTGSCLTLLKAWVCLSVVVSLGEVVGLGILLTAPVRLYAQ